MGITRPILSPRLCGLASWLWCPNSPAADLALPHERTYFPSGFCAVHFNTWILCSSLSQTNNCPRPSNAALIASIHLPLPVPCLPIVTMCCIFSTQIIWTTWQLRTTIATCSLLAQPPAVMWLIFFCVLQASKLLKFLSGTIATEPALTLSLCSKDQTPSTYDCGKAQRFNLLQQEAVWKPFKMYKFRQTSCLPHNFLIMIRLIMIEDIAARYQSLRSCPLLNKLEPLSHVACTTDSLKYSFCTCTRKSSKAAAGPTPTSWDSVNWGKLHDACSWLLACFKEAITYVFVTHTCKVCCCAHALHCDGVL